MITLSLLVCLIGLIIWLVFTKSSIADGWAARVGEIMFAAGLLSYLLNVGMKTI